MPDVDVVSMLRRDTKSCVYISESMHSTRRVKLKIDIEYTSLCAGECPQSVGTLSDGDAQLDKRE